MALSSASQISLQDPDGPQTRVGSLALAVKPVIRDPVGLGVTETG